MTGKADESGKAWCEGVMREYEADPKGFREHHSKDLRAGQLSIVLKEKDVQGVFDVSTGGEYSCAFWTGGLVGPHGAKYSSTTHEWVITK